MSKKREFPILNGKLISDLDANGFKILGADDEVLLEKFKDAIASDLEAKADKTALDAHVANTNNPHAVTAAQVGALPLVDDHNGKKTAVTIGSRDGRQPVGLYSLANGFVATASGSYSHAEGRGTTASGNGSHAEGEIATASGNYSHAEGSYTTASGLYSHAAGYMAQTRSGDDYSFAWNGDEKQGDPYLSHGIGTFNINPFGGLDGFYIGEQTLASILTNKADASSLAPVATSGNYDDLRGKPGNVSAFANDAGYLTAHQSWSDVKPSGGITASDLAAAVQTSLGKADTALQAHQDISGKADKEDVLPRYLFTSAGIADGVVTIPPYTSADMSSDGTAFTVAVGEGNGYMRDCILIVECIDVAPSITWPANFHPRTDAETDFACVAGVNNVYWISEYVQGEFVVAGWQATAGGSAQ